MAVLHPAPWLACNQQCQDPAASSSGCHVLLWYWFKAPHCHWCTKQRALWELHLHKINRAWNKWTVFGEAEWQRLERLSFFPSLLASGVMVCSWPWPLTSLEGGQFLHNIKFYFKITHLTRGIWFIPFLTNHKYITRDHLPKHVKVFPILNIFVFQLSRQPFISIHVCMVWKSICTD